MSRRGEGRRDPTLTEGMALEDFHMKLTRRLRYGNIIPIGKERLVKEMGNDEQRKIYHQGLLITLDRERGGWLYSVTNPTTQMCYYTSSVPMSFKEALSDAKDSAQEIIDEQGEFEEYVESAEEDHYDGE